MKPRLVFLIPGLSVGGAERHTLDLRSRLAALGFPTGLIVHGRRKSEVMLSHPGATGAVFLDIKGMSDPQGWRRVRAELGRQAPDVIIGVNQMPLIVAVVTRLLGGTRAKIACVFHTTVLQPSEERQFFLFRWALRFADALVFVGANQRAYWTGKGLSCRRMPVIRNGVDLRRFSPDPQSGQDVRARYGLGADAFVIGMVAAFRAEKNHLALVEALGLLRDRGVPAHVLFVGDGPTRSGVEQQAAALGVLDRITFAGEQTDVRPYVAASDVGVLCSVTETMPLSALEFLAMGVPMVMSDVGGASEIVQNGVNGWLFGSGDVPQFADRLQALSSPAARTAMRRDGPSGYQEFSIEAMIERYVGLVTELKQDT